MKAAEFAQLFQNMNRNEISFHPCVYFIKDSLSFSRSNTNLRSNTKNRRKDTGSPN